MTDTNDVAKLVESANYLIHFAKCEKGEDEDAVMRIEVEERVPVIRDALTRIAAERDEAVRLRPKVLSMNCNAILLRAEAAERERDTLKAEVERLREAITAFKPLGQVAFLWQTKGAQGDEVVRYRDAFSNLLRAALRTEQAT